MQARSLFALFLLTGCAGTVEHRGHQIRPEAVAQIQPGIARSEVIRLLGSPSSQGVFDSNIDYYIGSREHSIAFFDPTVLERTVLVLRYDETESLQSMQALSKEDGREVALVDRETPTAGHSLGFWEQLFGNLGRFNAPSSGIGGLGRRGGSSSVPGG